MISKGDEPDENEGTIKINYPYRFYPLMVNMTVEIAALLESKEAKYYLHEIQAPCIKLQRFIEQNSKDGKKNIFTDGEDIHLPNTFRHKQLHSALDELGACYLEETNFEKLFGDTTVMELMQWSYAMTQVATCEEKPDEQKTDSSG